MYLLYKIALQSYVSVHSFIKSSKLIINSGSLLWYSN